jgi:uncharacterized hydrophobic protein (TIGR00271 family)
MFKKTNKAEPDHSDQVKKEDVTVNQSPGHWLGNLHIFKGQKLSQTRKAIVLNDLIDSSSPGLDYFILIILSCTIATFGLLTDSAAVIIGAMLVAPLMSPILSLSMASISGLSRLFRRSLIAILEGAGLAIFLSSILAFISYRLPFGVLAQIPAEVLARTSPNPMDLGIAIAGGAAAAYALAHPRLTAALPGVAIATALMPPLCSVGIGIAFVNTSIIFGALLLFITNMVAISFAGILTFAALGFGPRNMEESHKISRSLSISTFLVVVIGLLLAILAWNTINEARLYNQASSAIMESVNQYTSANLVDLVISSEDDTKNITVTLRTARDLSYAEVVDLQAEIAEKLNSPIALELVTIPMQILDPQNTPTSTPAHTYTPTVSPTITPTHEPSPTPTPTLEPSATPAPAFITTSSRHGIDIYDMPGGAILFHLPEDTAVKVFIQIQQTLDNVVWVEIHDPFNRSGWMRAEALDIPLQ